MRNWLIYITAFLGGLAAAYLGLIGLAGTMLGLGHEVASFIGLILSAMLPAYGAFVAIYALLHRWHPGVQKILLGLGVCCAIALAGLLLMYSEVMQIGPGIGVMVLAAFGAGRYLTVRYGNG